MMEISLPLVCGGLLLPAGGQCLAGALLRSQNLQESDSLLLFPWQEDAAGSLSKRESWRCVGFQLQSELEVAVLINSSATPP